MYNVTPSAVGVIVYKVVGNRYLEKRVNLRVEHVRHSKCRQEFLDRVKTNHEAHVKAKATGGEYHSLRVILCSLNVNRAGELEAWPCPSSGGVHRYDNRQRSPDYGSRALRDHHLNAMLVHIIIPSMSCTSCHICSCTKP